MRENDILQRQSGEAMTPLMNVVNWIGRKKKNDFGSSLIHCESNVCGLAIISVAEWCILHTYYARDGNRQERICKTSKRFAKSMQKGVCKVTKAPFP